MANLVQQQRQQHSLHPNYQRQGGGPPPLTPSPTPSASPTASSLIAPPPPAPGTPNKPPSPTPAAATGGRPTCLSPTAEMNRLNLLHQHHYGGGGGGGGGGRPATSPMTSPLRHLRTGVPPLLLRRPSFSDVGLALVRMGKSVALSVEMLSAVAEAIGEDAADGSGGGEGVRREVQAACR